MPAYKDTIEDFNLKWGHTFALLNNEVVWINQAYYADEEDEKSGEYFIDLHVNKQGKRVANQDFNSFSPIVVDSQFFNWRPLDGARPTIPTCLRIVRSSKRQNKRSLCDEQSSITAPAFPIISKFTPQARWNYTFTEPFVKAILAKQYVNYYHALQHIKAHIMLAVSPNFAVMASHVDDKKCLFASQWGFIGTATEDCIEIHHKPSFQEVNDYVYRHNLLVRVNLCQ